MNTYQLFGSETEKQVHLNYIMAKWNVKFKNWYADKRIEIFITNINRRMNFNEDYDK